MSKGSKGWIWGAAIGTIVGSVTALLFAPKPGKELRKDIADGARQVGEKTGELAGKVSEQSAYIAEKVKETAGNIIQDIQGWRDSKGEEEEDKEVQISAITTEYDMSDTNAAIAIEELNTNEVNANDEVNTTGTNEVNSNQVNVIDVNASDVSATAGEAESAYGTATTAATASAEQTVIREDDKSKS
ncbi:YtxH domain-containing protein [Paenibacillus fonticola]|uniref:YtxH domain-containing protein n=1 Tax=Paenibacillus fonticola TaxID=379896 RepID=UPI00036C9849|nr:YtxH domain-containing protein [Paenibacillus fonticola]